MGLRERIGVFVFAVGIFPISLHAAVDLHFSTDDLRALTQLAKPSQSTLRLDGRTGEFVPAPALQFTGLDPAKFEMNLNVGEIVDLKFNALRSKSFSLAMEEGFARLDIAIEDQQKAIRSVLGAVHVKGVVLSAWFRFAPDGSPYFVTDRVALAGELKGTGLLKPQWIIDALRKLALKILREQVERQVNQASFQKAVEDGMVIWARFSKDERLTKVLKGTPKITATGLRFQAE